MTGAPPHLQPSTTRADGTAPAAPHRVVIVGGGAGGLALAARLAGRRRRADALEVTLVDANLTHVWKPQLHELAAGTLQGAEQEVDFLQQARRHGFRFHFGRLSGLDRAAREVWLDALHDDDGTQIAPRRALAYDTLVLAVGSVVNDFGTPGVREHAMTLDDATDARRFHRRLLAAWARAELQATPAGGAVAGRPIDIAIVGGGATGVELAAELAEAVPEIAGYGRRLSQLPRPVRIHLVEGGDRLVAALPPPLSAEAEHDLRAAGVSVWLKQRVTAVLPDGVQLGSGERIPADMVVWAAGIRGPDVLRQLEGLAVNRVGQLLLRPTLQTVDDDRVFALGDCGTMVSPGADAPVPPRAQVAQQQAVLLADSLLGALDGRPLRPFVFHDKGALVSLGRRNAVGRIVARLPRWAFTLQGMAARWAYAAVQRQHLVTLHGAVGAALATVGSWLTRRAQPRVKLH